MANRKSIGGVLSAVVLATVVTVYQENIAAWLEAHKLNSIFVHSDILKALSVVGEFFTSSWMTHIYAFIDGFFTFRLLQMIVEGSGDNSSDTQGRPNMTLSQALIYLTSSSQWAVENSNASNRMLQHELIDALASGQLRVLARLHSYRGDLSPLYEVRKSYFNDVVLDVDALRRNADNAICPSPDSFHERYVDFRVWRSEVERAWPPIKPVSRKKLLSKSAESKPTLLH